jgi:general stress protein YciG
MGGTRSGGLKAAAKNLANNPNFYRDIGRIGGRNGRTGGFAANPELAKIAGRKGGLKSRRNKAKVKESE